MAGCGVCHTDLGFLHDGVRTRHPLPLILGHEISGYVEDAGSRQRGARRPGGRRAGRAALRRVRAVPLGAADDLRVAGHAGQRPRRRLRDARRSCRAFPLPRARGGGGSRRAARQGAGPDAASPGRRGRRRLDGVSGGRALGRRARASWPSSWVSGAWRTFAAQVAAERGAAVSWASTSIRAGGRRPAKSASRSRSTLASSRARSCAARIAEFARAAARPRRAGPSSSARARPPASRRPSACSSTARRSWSSASRSKPSRCGSRISWPSTRGLSATGAARRSSTRDPGEGARGRDRRGVARRAASARRRSLQCSRRSVRTASTVASSSFPTRRRLMTDDSRRPPSAARSERSGEIQRIVLDRPKGNVLDLEMITAIRARLRRAREGPRAAQAPRLRRRGRALQLRRVGSGAPAGPGRRAPPRLPRPLPATSRRSATPTAAVVRGQCLGGAFELALWCGVVFCEASARFGVPETRLGVFPPVAAIALAVARDGRASDADDVSGDTFDAQGAAAWGLIDRCNHDAEAALQRWFEERLARQVGRRRPGGLAGVAAALSPRLWRRPAGAREASTSRT